LLSKGQDSTRDTTIKPQFNLGDTIKIYCYNYLSPDMDDFSKVLCPKLKDAILFFKENPEVRGYMVIHVDTADNFPLSRKVSDTFYNTNDTLTKSFDYSERKFKKIRKLMKIQGVDNEIIFVMTFGKKNNRDKKQNRRIDIVIRDTAQVKYVKGQIIKLEKIQFESGKSTLLPASYSELNSLTQKMITNTKMKIEISGHTDNIGTREFNLKLSESRAKSVAVYIISKGISADRIIYKGYADLKPIADNNSEQGRALNRRVEFKIIEN